MPHPENGLVVSESSTSAAPVPFSSSRSDEVDVIQRIGERNKSEDMPPTRPRTSSADESESAPIFSHAKAAKNYEAITSGVDRDMGNGAGEARTRDSSRRREGNGDGQAVGAVGAEGGSGTVEEKSVWRTWISGFGAIELENKGSVARDHLALERTFLAWLRTSLSFASIGIAITQLFRLNTTISPQPPVQNPPSQNPSSPQTKLRHVGKPLGATFIALSILILFIGFHRYFSAQHYVIRGKFPASRGSVVLVTLVAGALMVSCLVVILSVAPGAFER